MAFNTFILIIVTCFIIGCSGSASQINDINSRLHMLESKLHAIESKAEDLQWLSDMRLQKLIGERIGYYSGFRYGFLMQDGETFTSFGGIDHVKSMSRSDIRIGTHANVDNNGTVTKLKIGSRLGTSSHYLHGFFLKKTEIHEGMPAKLNGFYVIGTGPHSEYDDDVHLAIKILTDDMDRSSHQEGATSAQKLAE